MIVQTKGTTGRVIYPVEKVGTAEQTNGKYSCNTILHKTTYLNKLETAQACPRLGQNCGPEL